MVTRRQAKEEAEQVRLQHNIVPGHSAFLLEGIVIENVQYASSSISTHAHILNNRNRREVSIRSKNTATDHQKTTLLESCTHLLRRIQRFRLEQDTHMPRVASIIVPEDTPSTENENT